KYAGYSLSYQQPDKRERIGVIWTEDSNMTSFFNIMNASSKAIRKQLSDKLYLIRISSIGNSKLKGYQLYQQIFQSTENIHIKPNLTSVQQLSTYHSLVNSALANELVIAGKTVKLEELQSLIRDSQLLNQCTLLQNLELVVKPENTDADENIRRDWKPVKDFLLNLVKTQSFMGILTLISQCIAEFTDVSESDVKLLIQSLCDERKVKIMNSKAKLEDQLICLVA
ncbi:MAG: ATP-binding protein, partial [Cyanobacteria bacterium P01_D01_bin.116]